MPSTKGVEVFIRKNPLTDKEWLGLIEARRELIKPYLDSITLPELGSLECLKIDTYMHALNNNAPSLTEDEQLSLKTQGLFFKQPRSVVKEISGKGCLFSSGGITWVWGLTRSGLWVLVTINFIGELGYKNRGYERAETVEIVESDLSTIVAITKEEPQQMWKELGETIKGFAEHHKPLYNQMLRLAQMVEIEELALELVP